MSDQRAQDEVEHDGSPTLETSQPALRIWNSRFLDKIVALSLYSLVGESLRVLTSNLFGLACQHPGTVGWNESEWAPCTTAPGSTSATGGALFTDLPANLLGCFLMGLFVSGHDDTLQLPVRTNLAFLRRHSVFQSWTVTHLALRTGLCGSLTTFSSWNAQMVVMICGGKGTELGTQWVSALFGYGLGWMVALQAYHIGRHVALVLHRWQNPDLAQEADFLHEKRGVVLNHDLPDIERRFLYDLGGITNHLADDDDSKTDDNAHGVSESGFRHLQKWKAGTHRHRHEQVESGGSFLTELHEIERVVLVDREEPKAELLEVASNAGWDVDALRQWQMTAGREKYDPESHPRTERAKNDSSERIRYEQLVNLGSLVVGIAMLVWGVVAHSGPNPVSMNYRSSFLAALLASPGTLIRWRLSRWNGKIQSPKWHWLPIGTLTANMLGFCLSSLMLGILLEIGDDARDNTVVVLGAIKTGFAGSLSTVSSFAAELSALLQVLPQHSWGYYYLGLTLIAGCTLGVIFYAWAV